MAEAFSLRLPTEFSLDISTLQFIANAIPHQVWIADKHGQIIYGNEQWHDYTGFLTHEVENEVWRYALHPDDHAKIRHAWQEALATGTDLLLDVRLQRSDGVYRWHQIHSTAQRDAQGCIALWIGTNIDIDEQKRMEQTLKVSEENFRLLAETIPQLVWIAQSNGMLIYVNQRYSDYIRATLNEVQGLGWHHFVHPDDLKRVLVIREHSLVTGAPYEAAYRFRQGQTGLYRWFLARAMPIHDEAGKIVKWFGTSTDIDEQKRTEEDLRKSQAHVHALMDSNIIGIIVIEGDTIIEANDAYLNLTGYTREEVQNKTLKLSMIVPPEQNFLLEHARQELVSHQQVMPFEAVGLNKDGKRIPLLIGTVALQLDPLQHITFLLDISARKELEQRKDAFISMASHELKTPLTILKMQVQRLKKQWTTQGVPDEIMALKRIDTQINRLNRLIEELLDISKINAGKMEYVQEVVDLDALLHETAEAIQQTGTTHTIVVYGATHASLIGDKERLAQVFINLISNAIKYSPIADTVEVDLDASAKQATVQVRDHGIGIPQDQHQHIFERFYRAINPNAQTFPGLGMGLYIAAEIVKRHGGTITVESTIGQGSTFRVALPLAPKE